MVFACVYATTAPIDSRGGAADAGPRVTDLPLVAEPSWVYRPLTLEGLTSNAELVVRAEVTGVDSGPDLTGMDDAESVAGGLLSASTGQPRAEEPPIPTQRVAVRTLESLKGNAPAALSLFKTGSADFLLEGDPSYAVGERYLLFLVPRADGTYVPVAPDGRLLVTSTGAIEPVIQGDVANEVAGDSVQDVEAAVRQADAADDSGTSAGELGVEDILLANDEFLAAARTRHNLGDHRARKWFAGGYWIHQHTRDYPTYSGIDNRRIEDFAQSARREWAVDTTLSLPQAGHDASRMHLMDGDYGRTGWSGLASQSFHDNHGHVQYNLFYLRAASDKFTRGVACQEMGHILGLDHGGHDCMVAGYQGKYPYTAGVGGFNIELVRDAYSDH